jgi:hypothetical protein
MPIAAAPRPQLQPVAAAPRPQLQPIAAARLRHLQPIAAAVAVPPPPRPLADPPPPPPPLAAADSAPSQSDLLRRAWASTPADALDLVAQDAQLHPDGPLSEEREALRINLLAKLHRLDEARTAAAQFLARHPDSVHRPMIERAIQPEPSP